MYKIQNKQTKEIFYFDPMFISLSPYDNKLLISGELIDESEKLYGKVEASVYGYTENNRYHPLTIIIKGTEYKVLSIVSTIIHETAEEVSKEEWISLLTGVENG